MQSILRANKGANPHGSFHPGDLEWWFFYGDAETDLSARARIWTLDDRPIAWTFCTLDGLDYDIAVHHAFLNHTAVGEILDQMESFLTAHARTLPANPQGKPFKITTYVDADETSHIELLQQRNYTGSAHLVCFGRDLHDDLPEITLPDGYSLLDRMRDDLADMRAEAHFSAFSPGSKMTGARYRYFMTAPSYNPEMDIVVLNPQGRPVAFGMGWLDDESKVGLFEPVGTHQDYQRKGLGRAAMREGMRRMKERGMTVATVNTTANDEDNIAFYHAAGFATVNHILKFEKVI